MSNHLPKKGEAMRMIKIHEMLKLVICSGRKELGAWGEENGEKN